MDRYTYIHNKIWTDEKFMELDQDSKMLVLYILTSPHCNMIGYYRMPLQYAAGDLGWELDRLTAAFSRLEQAGMVRYDARPSVVLIPNFLKYNRICNINQAKGACNVIKKLPQNALLPDFLEAVSEYSPDYLSILDQLGRGVPSPSPSPFGTVSTTVTKSDTQDTEYRVQSTDLSSPNGDSSGEPDGGAEEADPSPTELAGEAAEGEEVAEDDLPISPEEADQRSEQVEQEEDRRQDSVQRIMDEYNRIFAAFWSRPLAATKGRRSKIKARLRTFTVEQLIMAMESIRGSPWHMGQNDRNTFYASPEFIFRNDDKVDEWLKRKKPSKGDASGSEYDDLWVVKKDGDLGT